MGARRGGASTSAGTGRRAQLFTVGAGVAAALGNGPNDKLR